MNMHNRRSFYIYKEFRELQQETQKQWTVREKAISEREKQFEELKTKVEAFPKEKEAAIKKATEEGKGIASYQAKVKADLYAKEKEVEGKKRFYEERLQSLELTITNQETRLQNLS
jgi:membrane protein involved in colicin uptake